MSFRRESLRSKRKRSQTQRARKMVCETLEPRVVLSATIGNNIGAGDQLQNYRLAIAATAEYTDFFGGQTQALAAIESFVSSVNEIFEEELSIHFDLVSGISTIFTDAGTDGYINGNTTQMIGVNTSILDSIIESQNYDIGHVFGTSVAGSAGLAGLRVVNGVSTKGRGASVSSNPQGPSWVELVGHEFGHQFGAQHTFNANAFGAAISQRTGSNAYEPASGSTIMSYAGISNDLNGDDNLQLSPDDYFHSASFEQIQTFIAGAGAPNSTTATGNNIPTVAGGTDYTIPAGTPFELTAIGSDVDAGDTLTYTWEQLDLGPAMSLSLTDNGSSPLFRAFPPSTDSNRVFPRLSDLAAGVNTAEIGEALPTTTRSLNFRSTVRDGNNGVNSDDVLISVVAAPTTPFAITAPNGAENWSGGTSQTITWNVGGTDANGINVANVAIDLSLDGGVTYPFTLGLSTPNDGSHTINSPNIDVATARIRVRPVGNIFFDISDANFTITANAGAAGVTVTESGGSTLVSEDGVVGAAGSDSYTLALNTAATSTVTITVDGGSQTEVSLDNVNFASSVLVNRSDITAQTIYVRGLDDTLAEGIHFGTITQLITASSDPNYPLGATINPVIASIADDELQPVVGVDFDEASGSSPANWTKVSDAGDGTYSGLIREDGVLTSIDLSVTASGPSIGVNPSTPNAAPLHSPPLDGVDGNRLSSQSLTLTWSGLTPGTDYNLYLLLTENFVSNVLQNISITGGAGDPLPFVQDTSAIGNGLLVNRGLADPSKPIEADAVIAQADAAGEIRIVVSDISGGGVDDALLSGAAIQEIGPATIGFGVIQSGDSTTVTESGTTDSFDVVLFSQPTGNVVINVSSGDPDEATAGPTTLTFESNNWDDPQTVTVTGVDDALVDGSQTSTVTLSIDTVLTTDDAFDAVDDRLVTVVTQDDEAASLVGVDFDNTGSSPTNWTTITGSNSVSVNDLIGEDGTATTFDLSVVMAGGVNVADTPQPSNLPDHIPSLADIDGLRLASTSIVLTWSDLSPGTDYDLWLFTTEDFGQFAIQLVTITGGAGNPAPFTMDTSSIGPQLLVNSVLASPSRTLQNDAVRATASASGEIQIAVTNNGGDFAALNGAAIQEVVAAPIPDRDYGDAPTAAQSGFAASYPVTLADDGARHTPTGPTLGAARDAEANGVPSTAADGDDLAGVNDEDGVVFAGLGIQNTTAAVNILMGSVAPAKVDAWIDFNRDGDWDDAGEKILDSVDVSNAMQTLNYTVPAGITAGDTYARVRLSTAGGLSPTGLAADGEVEDHLIHIGSPQVESVVINGGDPQRSGITTVQVTFDRVVDIDFGGDVFEFVNTTTSETVIDFSVVTEVAGKTVVDFTFLAGPSVNSGGGLNDGDYVLTIDADRVDSAGDPLDGNGDGTPGDDYVFGASAVDNFYRKYGDFNANGTVELFDFAAFRSSFGKSAGQAGYEPGLDAQNDGIIDLFDFAQFRANFGT